MNTPKRVSQTNLREVIRKMADEAGNQSLASMSQTSTLDRAIAELLQTRDLKAVDDTKNVLADYDNNMDVMYVALKLIKTFADQSPEPSVMIGNIAHILKIDYVHKAVASKDYYKASGMVKYLIKSAFQKRRQERQDSPEETQKDTQTQDISKKKLHEQRQDLRKKRILVVSSDDYIRSYVPSALNEALESMFKRRSDELGYETIPTDRTNALLRLRESQQYKLVILDIGMKNLESDIKSIEGYHDIPILYVTTAHTNTAKIFEGILYLPPPKESHLRGHKEEVMKTICGYLGEILKK